MKLSMATSYSVSMTLILVSYRHFVNNKIGGFRDVPKRELFLLLGGLTGLHRLIWIVAGVRVEHSRIESLIDAHRKEEALARHVAVEIARDVIGCNNPARDLAVVLINLFFEVFLPVYRVTPLER